MSFCDYRIWKIKDNLFECVMMTEHERLQLKQGENML